MAHMAHRRQAYVIFWGNPREIGNFGETVVFQDGICTCKSTLRLFIANIVAVENLYIYSYYIL
jgi:hypothetical protein